jgi:hypothetical protein
MDSESSQCPRCGCWHSRVIETRIGSIRGYPVRVRVRACRHCYHTFRTKEIVDNEVKLPQRHRPAAPEEPLPREEEIRPEPPSGFFFPPA